MYPEVDVSPLEQPYVLTNPASAALKHPRTPSFFLGDCCLNVAVYRCHLKQLKQFPPAMERLLDLTELGWTQYMGSCLQMVYQALGLRGPYPLHHSAH